MTLSPTSDLPRAEARGAHPPGTLRALRVGYEQIGPRPAALDALLAEEGVLAVIGFGDDAPASHADPRYLHVALQPATPPAPFEVWRTTGAVIADEAAIGVGTRLRWANSADYAFGSIELDESAHGGLAGAAEVAYRRLAEHLARGADTHVLRIWNYLDAINLGADDAERYRQFCSGRVAGMRDGFGPQYSAATAVGVRDGRRVLQVYWLSARSAGVPLENPRQMNAWRYPRQYGPDAPSFARAMRAPTRSVQVYISGTAAIVGHASRHRDDFPAQVHETLANIDSVLATAQIDAADRFGAHALIKAYIRREEDLAPARTLLAASLPCDTQLLLLRGDICRSELLIEIDGVQGV